MSRGERFDLIIIGAGAAGLIAADFARGLGAEVGLVEADRIGGDCTWTGCVPSKSLLKAASVAAAARESARLGIFSSEPRADMSAVREYVRACIALGASIVGQRAGEVIAELSLAMSQHLRLQDLASAIHPYPTYSSAVQLLATQMAVRQFMGGWRGRMVRRLSRLWLRV